LWEFAIRRALKLDLLAYKDENNFKIYFRDTGIGIPHEARNKLFTPLFTTKSKRQDFGLAAFKRLMEALGGSITFESKVGEGTKFTIRFPPKETDGKFVK